MYIVVASVKGTSIGFYGPFATWRDAKHAMRDLKVQIKENYNVEAQLRIEELNAL